MTPERPMQENKEKEPKSVVDHSMSVDAYYKGFHVKIIQTEPTKKDGTFQLVANAKELIDLMEKDEWEPSWNPQTNKQIKSGEDPGWMNTGEPNKEQGEITKLCGIHNTQMKKRTGKKGNVFFSHARQNDQTEKWEYCSGRGFPGE